jgi:hypothetical protein
MRGHDAERLSVDPAYLRIEVGQQQPGQLQAALVHQNPPIVAEAYEPE